MTDLCGLCSTLEGCLARLGAGWVDAPQRKQNYDAVETVLEQIKQQAKLQRNLTKASHATHMQTQRRQLSQMDASAVSQLSSREESDRSSSDDGSSSNTPAASPRDPPELSKLESELQQLLQGDFGCAVELMIHACLASALTPSRWCVCLLSVYRNRRHN